MKILVFADFHGNARAIELAADISRREAPNKTVICGDIFGWNKSDCVIEALNKIQGILYFIKGNNDWQTELNLLPGGAEDYAVMYHFGRTLFFTHGDRYNAMRIPPLLKEGDALIHGHTHFGRISEREGVLICNVGSLARPRDCVANYLILDEQGAMLKDTDGALLQTKTWKEFVGD